MAEMTIKRVGVLSLAKLQGFLMMIIGLFIGVIYGLVFMIFGAAMTSLAPQGEGQAIGGIGTVFIGLLMMIGIPLFYGGMGFIGGAVGGLIYNAAARFVGGIKIELESDTPSYAPPQWGGQYQT